MKRIIALVMSLIVVFMMVVPTGMTAFAAEKKDPLAIEIVTDKSSYGLRDTVNVTVKVKNQSGSTMKGLVIVPSMSKHLLTKDSSTKFDIDEISNNETKTVSFKAVLSRNANGLNFFQRFILLFHYLFKGVKTKSFENVSYTDKSCLTAEKDVSHKVNDTINVSVWYQPLQDEPVIIETATIESFSSALSEIIKEQKESASFSVSEAQNNEYYSRRVIVKGTNLSLDGFDPVVAIHGSDDVYIIQFDSESEAKRFVEIQNKKSNIDFAEPDNYVFLDPKESVTLEESDSSGVLSFNSWGVEHIQADQYASYLKANNYNSSITVAVIDTGADFNHTYLKNNLLNTGYDFARNDKMPDDEHGHGTHVSGTIIDCTNGLNVKILPVKIFDASGRTSSVSIIGTAVKYASEKDAKVINMSLGGSHSSYTETCINDAIKNGVTVCVAAGNGDYYGNPLDVITSKTCPAHISTSGCICVAAINEWDEKASFSNYGNTIDVAAPGVSVKSCIPGGKYASWDGTSMATPHVSACAAMLKLANPSASPAQIEKLIRQYTEDLGTTGWDKYFGYGVPKLSKAIPQTSYQLTVSKGTGISSVSGGGTYKAGDTVTVTASVSSGYTWNNWTSSNTSLLGNNSNQTYSFKMPAGNVTLTASAVQKYNLTVSKGTGIDSVSNGGSYKAGDTVTVTASVTSGYQWNQWTSSNTLLLSNSTSQTYSFKMPAGNVTLTASAALKKYTLTVNTGTGISSVSGSGSYAPGTSVTVKAVISNGYTWEKWTSSNTSLVSNSTSQTYTFTMPSGNVTLTPSATVTKYTVTVAKGIGISSVTGGGAYTPGTSVTVNANLLSGYTWKKWTSNNTSLLSGSSNRSYTFKMPAGNVTLTASAVATKYNVTVNTGTGISSVSGGGSYAPGSSVTVKAVVSNGYTWKKWTSSNTSLVPNSTSQTYTFTMPSRNVTLTPSATVTKYTVSVAKGTGISSVTGGGTYTPGTSVTVNATVADGYTWKQWDSSNTSLLAGSTSRSYSFVMPSGNVTLTATSTVTTYKLSYSANGGTGAPADQAGATNYLISSTRPTRAGYNFAGWSKSSGATSASYQPEDNIALSGDTTLYAVWSQYLISSGSNLSTSVSYAGQIYWYKFTPSSSGTYVMYSTGDADAYGYIYNASGSELSNNDDGGDNRSFRLVYNLSSGTTYYYGVKYYSSSNTGTISVKFGLVYTISYNANGGSGAPSSQTKDWGKDITLSSDHPTQTGYSFLGWSTSSSATSASYQPGDTFSYNGNYTLYAVWNKIAYKLSYNANNGTGAPDEQTGATTYTISSVRPTRVGYNFAGWATSSSASSASYQPGNTITLSGNLTLYAVWTQHSISSGSSLSTAISYAGQIYWYKFTPSTNGTYVMYSTGSYDTYCYLYNSAGSQIAYNDDGGTDSNFRLSYSLSSGTVYYFGVKYYSSSNTGTISAKFGSVYTISYNANGGSGAPSSQTKDWGKDITLSSDRPTQTGYSFLGWSTSSSATSASYQPSGTISSNSNYTLYAVWSKIAATSLSLSSSSKTLTITDTDIEITECPDSVKVPDSIGLSVSHSWNYPTYTFTATVGPSNAYNLGVSVTSSDTSVVKVTSTSRSGNVTTITVQAQDVGYNNTKTATITVKLNDNSSVSKTCSITVKRPHSLNITSSNENVIKTWGGWTSPSAVGTARQTYARVTITVTTYQGNTASKTITVYPPDTFYTVKNSDYNGYAVRSTPGGTSVGGVNNYLTLPVTKCQYIDGATYGYVTYNNSTQGWGTGYGWIKMYSWN